MSVLASGAIPADEAIGYVAGLKQVEAIVFGASSRGNILQTKAMIDKWYGTPAMQASSLEPSAA